MEAAWIWLTVEDCVFLLSYLLSVLPITKQQQQSKPMLACSHFSKEAGGRLCRGAGTPRLWWKSLLYGKVKEVAEEESGGEGEVRSKAGCNILSRPP